MRIGSSYWKYGGQFLRVARIVIHHYYRKSFDDFDNDIALMKLQEPVTSKKARPARILTKEISMKDQGVTVAGWGRYTLFTSLSDGVRAIDVRGYSYRSCKEIYGDDLTKNMFCAGVGRRESCMSDSGGSAMIGSYVVGYTLFEKGCGYGNPGVYMNIQRYVPWIKFHTGLEI